MLAKPSLMPSRRARSISVCTKARSSAERAMFCTKAPSILTISAKSGEYAWRKAKAQSIAPSCSASSADHATYSDRSFSSTPCKAWTATPSQASLTPRKAWSVQVAHRHRSALFQGEAPPVNVNLDAATEPVLSNGAPQQFGPISSVGHGRSSRFSRFSCF